MEMATVANLRRDFVKQNEMIAQMKERKFTTHDIMGIKVEDTQV